MPNKICAWCSNCGKKVTFSDTLEDETVMYVKGNRAVGSAFYCSDCVMSWKDRNGKKFDDHVLFPRFQFDYWFWKIAEVTSDAEIH